MAKKLVANNPAGSNPPSNAPSNLPSDLPTNPPSNLSSALLPQNAGSAETAPRVAPAPVKKPAVKLGDPITVVWDFHELANLLPMSDTEAFAKLRADIEKYGLLEPITVWDGKILDGRNRAMACKELGIEPKYVEYTGNDPVGFVLSKNVHRRQLTQSQLAMLVKKLENLPKGRPDVNAHAFTQDEAAERLGVSKRLIQFAQKVHEKAIPEVVALVETGKLTLDKAATLAKATPDQQREAVAAVERGEKCPTFKSQKDSQGKNSKEPSLEEQPSDQLKAALAHPKDSPERSDALIELFKTLSDEAFAKYNPRQEFLQGIMAECAMYGVQLPTAGTET
jgi:ParB-like chromosome segregation protein Spo0J